MLGGSYIEKVSATSGVVESLVLDLLEWVAAKDRTYEEVIEAWRTSCPRLPVWEDANDEGFIRLENLSGTSFVRVTAAGHAQLKERRPHVAGL